LKDHIRNAGFNVKTVDVLCVPGGRSKGCAVVEFSDPGTCQQAIQALNNSELRGRQMFVREDRERDNKMAIPR
jgi:RNA recognition motif-containing protein